MGTLIETTISKAMDAVLKKAEEGKKLSTEDLMVLMMGLFRETRDYIDKTNDRIDETNKRIEAIHDGLNKRIDTLYESLGKIYGTLKNEAVENSRNK